MSRQLVQTISTVAVLAALPMFASAATLSVAEVTQVRGPNPFDPSPVSTVVSDSESIMDGTANAAVGAFDAATAEQMANGDSTVSTETGNDANTELATASASLTQTEVNNFGVDHDYFIDYELSGMATRLFHSSDAGLFTFPGAANVFVNPFADDDPTALIQSNYTAASFQYEILVNGVSEFTARADILVNEAGFTIENQLNFDVTVTETGFGGYLFEVGDIAGQFAVGTYADGEEIKVESILTSRAYSTNIFDELRNSVGARSTDPVTVSNLGPLASAPSTPSVSAVPLPAAGWLLIAGFGGLAAMKRRKTA